MTYLALFLFTLGLLTPLGSVVFLFSFSFSGPGVASKRSIQE